jgi:hypothetical protein
MQVGSDGGSFLHCILAPSAVAPCIAPLNGVNTFEAV